MEETKRTINFPSKPTISLKDVPPLDPSSISSSNSAKPRRRMVPVYVAKRRWEEKNDMKVQKTDEVEEDNDSSSLSTIHMDPNSTRSSKVTPEKEPVPEPKEALVSQTKSRTEDEPKRRSAKSKLHELCAAKHWKPPVYECCDDGGPSHMRSFTFKVLVEIIESSSNFILEAYGAPGSKKQTAAENAAEGALWYVKHSGHFRVTRRRRRGKPRKTSSDSWETV